MAAAIRVAAARLQTYVTLKDVKKRRGHGQEGVFPVAQFEKLWGDMTCPTFPMAWYAGWYTTRCPPAPAGGFLWAGRQGTPRGCDACAQEAPGGNPGTPDMTTIPPSMTYNGMQVPGSNLRGMARGKACDPDSPGFRRGLLVAPGFAPRRRSG